MPAVSNLKNIIRPLRNVVTKMDSRLSYVDGPY